MILPDPARMTLRDWAHAATMAVIQYANVNPMSGDDWQRWGIMFFNSPQLGSMHPPNPYAYKDWRKYGADLSQCLLNAKGSPPRVPA